MKSFTQVLYSRKVLNTFFFHSLTTLVLRDHVAVLAAELPVDGDGGLVQLDVGQGVVHVELVLLQDDGLDQALDALLK